MNTNTEKNLFDKRTEGEWQIDNSKEIWAVMPQGKTLSPMIQKKGLLN